MRKFMKIVESISHDITQNAWIEERLSKYEGEDQTRMRDGLQVIMDAGSRGVNLPVWVDRMRGMWPALDDRAMMRVFATMQHEFSGSPMSLFKRIDNGVYVWQNQPVADIDTTSPLAQAASSQIALVSRVHDIMKQLGAFMPGEVSADLSAQTGMDPEMASALVTHVIDNSAAMVKRTPHGYVWEEPASEGGLGFINKLDGYNGSSF